MNYSKLDRTQAETIFLWLVHNGYHPHDMTLKETITAARDMSKWFRNSFVEHTPINLAASILALQNGGEV